MFIKISNNRRLNLNSVIDYKPFEKTSQNNTHYLIKLKYQDNKEEDLSFLESEEKRNSFLKLLDDNLLLNEN